MGRRFQKGIALGFAPVLCLFALDWAAAATEVYLPQALRGNSQNTTRILVCNTSTTAASVTIEFFNQSGTRQETQRRTLGPDATEEVILGESTVGESPVAVTVGWVKVTSNQDVQVTAFFRLMGLPEVGVLPVKRASDWSAVGEVSATGKTGLAAANPDSVASTCVMTAYLANGQMAGEVDLQTETRRADRWIPGRVDLRSADSLPGRFQPEV